MVGCCLRWSDSGKHFTALTLTPSALLNDVAIYQWHSSRACSLAPTLFPVVDDVLAEQVIVAQHHRGAQGGQVLLHPAHLLLQHLLAGNLLLDSERGERRRSSGPNHQTFCGHRPKMLRPSRISKKK